MGAVTVWMPRLTNPDVTAPASTVTLVWGLINAGMHAGALRPPAWWQCDTTDQSWWTACLWWTLVLTSMSQLSNVCKTCFFWLRQLRRGHRSLDIESVKTLVHPFVTSRVDYCNPVLSSAAKKVTNKLQRIQNAAARLVTGTWKCERGLSWLMHDDLHWLAIPQWVQYKLAVASPQYCSRGAPAHGFRSSWWQSHPEVNAIWR